MDNELKREIILDNYMYPSNKEVPSDSSYIKVNTNNESCIDNLNIYVLIKDDVIVSIKFDGEACAISTSAASIMTKLLQNKTIFEVKKMFEEYNKMIENGTTEDNLEEALVFNDIYKQQNRKKCAVLPWNGIMNAISIYENTWNTLHR